MEYLKHTFLKRCLHRFLQMSYCTSVLLGVGKVFRGKGGSADCGNPVQLSDETCKTAASRDWTRDTFQLLLFCLQETVFLGGNLHNLILLAMCKPLCFQDTLCVQQRRPVALQRIGTHTSTAEHNEYITNRKCDRIIYFRQKEGLNSNLTRYSIVVLGIVCYMCCWCSFTAKIESYRVAVFFYNV